MRVAGFGLFASNVRYFAGIIAHFVVADVTLTY